MNFVQNVLLSDRLAASIAIGVLAFSCSSPQKLTFMAPQENKPLEVRELPFGNVRAKGKFLGKTPITLEIEKLQGKVIKLYRPGKLDQFWVFPKNLGKSNKIKVTLEDKPSEDNKAATMNQGIRLLLRAYQALSARRYPLAKKLAQQAAPYLPGTAGPLLIQGLAAMQSGDKPGAKILLTQAQAIDPQDTDIEAILKVLR